MTVLHILWIIFLYLLIIDCIIIVVGGTLWVLNIAWYELTGKDKAKEILEKWNNDRRS